MSIGCVFSKNLFPETYFRKTYFVTCADIPLSGMMPMLIKLGTRVDEGGGFLSV